MTLDPPSLATVMTPFPYAVFLDRPIAEAERHIGSAIVTRQGRRAGVLTWVDACRCLGTLLHACVPPAGGGDAA